MRIINFAEMTPKVIVFPTESAKMMTPVGYQWLSRDFLM